MKSPERQFAAFMAKYTPDVGRLAEEALTKLRALVPGAVEMAGSSDTSCSTTRPISMHRPSGR